MPCWVRKWNLTQVRSFAALMKLKVWLPKPCMWRKLVGMPRSLMTIVTWCSASGSSVQKSQLLSALRMLVRGSRLMAWLRSGKCSGIAEEEHRRVVADEVPVAFFGVELQREAANVALGVGGAALAGHGREAGEHRRLLADLREDLGLGVAGDVVRDGECAVCAGALGVHAPLGNHLAVEVGELFEQPDVLQQRRPARPGGLNVEIVGDRRTRCMRQRRTLGIIAHFVLLLRLDGGVEGWLWLRAGWARPVICAAWRAREKWTR